MKVLTVLAVLLVAGLAPKAEAGFLDFMGNFFKRLGSSALEILTDTGSNLLKNATTSTAHILSETGQYALFQMGNSGAGRKRDLQDINQRLQELQMEFDEKLGQSVQQALTAAEQMLTFCGNLVDSVISDTLHPLDAINIFTDLKSMVQEIENRLKGGLTIDLAAMLDRHVHDLKKDVLPFLHKKLEQFIQPFVATLQQELSTVINTAEKTAQHILSKHDYQVVLNDILSAFH